MSRIPPRNGVAKVESNTLLIDGNSLFKTGFFGAKDMYNFRGQHIGGVYQFLTVLRKLLSEDLYHRVFVFWDGNFSGKLRYDIYPPYKLTRGKDYLNGTQPIDESELSQRRLIQAYLDQLYIRQLKHEVVEGDDFVAYYCLVRKPNEKITIVSNDRDMVQLIDEHVRIYFLNFKCFVDNANFSEYFSYHNANAALMKIITGDASDNIKGIKGVKDTTLLNLFPDLKTKKITIPEIVEQAKELQNQRTLAKLKPLKVLTNIINSVTDGVQGDKIYEINSVLVDLRRPILTEDAVNQLEFLMDGQFTIADDNFKNVLMMMKTDGLKESIGATRYDEYLLPFKKLLERERKNQNKIQSN